MWELDHKEGWVPKNWCFQIVVLEITLKSPSDCKEIEPVNPKGKLPWIFIGRTGAKAEAPYFGHFMWRADSSEKTLMLGKIEGRRRRGWQRVRWLDGVTDSMDICAKSLQSCLTLCDTLDCSPPGFPVHGILQVRILEWVAISSSRGSSQTRDGTHVSYVSCAGRHALHP